ncbi:MAG: hypothetical protein JWO36_5349 [Myxococcales bacterium]|nr:hypothetical protein [Myxococcales bacterium]
MRTLLMAVASMGLVACVGQLDGGPGMGSGSGSDQGSQGGSGSGNAAADASRKQFNDTVYPVIAAKCAGCHTSGHPNGNVTGFVDSMTPAQDEFKAYDTITGYIAAVGNFTPTTANVLAKPLTGHQGTSYTTAEQTSITDWLNAEVAWRGAGAPPPPVGESPDQETARLLKEWSGCMTQTNFDTANMAAAWGQMQTNNGDQCQTCHVNGANGMIATQQKTAMFGVISTNKYYMLQFFTVDLTKSPAQVIINKQSFLGVSQGLVPHVEHPKFNAATNQGMTALDKFYASTMAAHAASPSLCGPSTLTN